MMKYLKYGIAAFFIFALVACEKGPAERAGENIDDAIDDAGRKIEDAGDEIDRSVN